MIMGRWPLPLIHLHKLRCRKGDSSALNESHQCHRPEGQVISIILTRKSTQARSMGGLCRTSQRSLPSKVHKGGSLRSVHFAAFQITLAQ